ncbi:MAG: ATP synthase F1 subunit gamma [candidate division Zixibacteria bacterium]|nr:ATP synthase F1 subunit gamma [candidate division Zixibacteria bacterium]
MPTLREVKKRIRSVISTKRITNAMEMVAAAKLRRAQQKVEQSRPYSKKMDEMLAQLAAGSIGEIIHPYFEERQPRKRSLVIFTSDRGLCGSFNSNIVRHAQNWLNEHKDTEVELITVGKKGNDFFKKRSWPVVNYYGNWGGSLNYDKARDMVRFLTDRFVAGETDEISLLFTRFISMVKYRISLEKYLPVARPEIKTSTNELSHGLKDYIFEPNAEKIYAALMPGYATTKMVTALVESFASEHGSRMIAMNAATKNAGEMVYNLTLDYNKARQAQITKELLEVVSGADALKG